MFALTKSQHGYGCNYQILCKSIIPLLIALLLIMVPSKICVGTGCLSEYAIDTCLMISLYDFRCLFIHFLSTHVWPGSTGADGLTLLGIECDRMYWRRIKRLKSFEHDVGGTVSPSAVNLEPTRKTCGFHTLVEPCT